MTTAVIDDELIERLKDYMVRVLKLGPDVEISPEASLIDQVGMDSLEAFDAIATLHELLGVSIPDTFNPKALDSLVSLAGYLSSSFPPEVVERFLTTDLSTIESLWSAEA